MPPAVCWIGEYGLGVVGIVIGDVDCETGYSIVASAILGHPRAVIGGID